MTPPRPRFTVWRIMVTVAVVALVLGTVAELRRRRQSFQQRAQRFERKVSAAILAEQSYRLGHRSNRPDSPFYYDNRTSLAYDRLVGYYDFLRKKYTQAADRPWLFLEPDPPEPWPQGVPRR